MKIKDLKNKLQESKAGKFVKKHKEDIIIVLGFGAFGAVFTAVLSKNIQHDYKQDLLCGLTIHDKAFNLAATDIISKEDANKIFAKADEYEGSMYELFRGVDSKNVNKIFKNGYTMSQNTK